MTTVATGLTSQLVLAGLAILVAVIAPAGRRSLLAGSTCAALGVAGVVTGLAAMAGDGSPEGLRIPVALPLDVPLEPLLLAPDQLGGVFLTLAGAVGSVAALYGIGYATGAAASRDGWAAFAVFLLGMQLAPAASDVTGERDLDRLGGLARVMPTTSLAFGVAALGAAALPVTSGFAAEWVLLQSLIHGGGNDDVLLAVLLPITVAVVALTAGLALLTFVKAYGIGFLARPRSDAAAHGHEGGPSMRAAMLVGTAAVVILGLAPGPVAAALAGALGASGIEVVGLLGVSLPGIDALLDPVALTLMAGLVLVPVLVVHALSARRAPRRDVDLTWSCGGIRVSPRMQYTATSYAEPLAGCSTTPCSRAGMFRSPTPTSRAAVLGPGFLRGVLVAGGLLSLAVAAALILAQRDYKRMLAYSSLEHMGIMALGAAVGGPLATAAVLLHMLGHGLVKAAMFVVAGRILAAEGQPDEPGSLVDPATPAPSAVPEPVARGRQAPLLLALGAATVLGFLAIPLAALLGEAAAVLAGAR